ncbi:hypothetical protein FA13DRAFT_1391407 [Coprinellus micaceus]|uniref:Nephrocystin 3-like N-terminal domain-containing protein n=1 Tax=Coprinellus micaceus TaxID=71717 RepID=A0A4Y7SQN9_COPMI|nr:hypothetical protein FA13DRAFT_1391407 [Coprinellus micaceus]
MHTALVCSTRISSRIMHLQRRCSNVRLFIFTLSCCPFSSPPITDLSSHIAHGAAHNSNERYSAPKCHPETRVTIQADIFGWIERDDVEKDPSVIMWLSGPAGAGKTAIAGSIAEACAKKAFLAASFFFSSFSPSTDRRSKLGLVATLAYHMSQNETLHLFKTRLMAALERHPDIFHKNLLEQTECLILAPFRSIHDPINRVGWPKVIIIDGLDEVVAAQYHDPTKQWVSQTSEDDQVEILNVLLALSRSTSFPFRIFVASRPERNIADFFAADAQSITVNLFLDSKYNPDIDIESFLKSKFSIIQHRAGISKSWPGKEVVDRIVDMSSGQFIVPTTIIRWVEAGVPQLQLAEVLELEQLKTGTKNPFATLDALYSHILRRARNPEADPYLAVKWILCISSAIDSNQLRHPPSVKFWRQLLETTEGELSYRLAPITSLIAIPPPDDTLSPITIYHKSLIDFLSSPNRCGDLHVEKEVYESFMAHKIVAVLKDKGPTHPLPPPELDIFLVTFFRLNLLTPSGDPGGAISTCSARFLSFLSDSLKAELASCDVAWWTDICLSVLASYDASYSPNRVERRHSWLLRAIYCGVHKAMGVSGIFLR